MTTDGLRRQLKAAYGGGPWPRTLEVDAETFAYVCQDLFRHLQEKHVDALIKVPIGPQGGLLFNGVELVLQRPTQPAVAS